MNLIYYILIAYIFYPKVVQFARNYDKEPILVIAASHNSEGNNLKPIHMSVAAWVEVKYDGNVVKSYNKKVRSKRRLLFYVKE